MKILIAAMTAAVLVALSPAQSGSDDGENVVVAAANAGTPKTKRTPSFGRTLSCDGSLVSAIQMAIENGLGDCLSHHPDDPAAVWTCLKKNRPDLPRHLERVLAEILNRSRFGPSVWGKPDASNDGFYQQSSGNRVQVAAIAFLGKESSANSAIARIKRCESSYRRYPEWKGLKYSYAEVSLMEKTKQSKKVTRKIRYEPEVPFLNPEIDVMVLDRPVSGGGWRCDYYSLHRKYRFEGRDEYSIVRNNSGEFVCLIVVTEYESEDSPRRTVRENLGSLIYRAEKGL